MTLLFEDKERDFKGSKLYAELEYEYLDRSARIEAKNVRDLLNSLFVQFPGEEKKEIYSRITGRDVRHYKSAIFELLLYGILKKINCEIEIHPTLNNGSTSKPDFLVKTPDGVEFYLEAVLASEYDDNMIAAEKRKDVVLDTINKLKSPNFLIGISAEGNPDTPPKGKPLRKYLVQWLRSLDPDIVINEIEHKGHDFLPTTTWNHEGWKIEFKAIPIRSDFRGQDGNVIGILSSGAKWVDFWTPLRNAITSKGNHYGRLDRPFLIAINADQCSLNTINEMQALFGQEQYIFNIELDNLQPDMQRAPNGAWYGERGIQYTRVSGAWFFNTLNTWNIVNRKHTIYFNPWASIPLPDFLTVFPHALAKEDKMIWNQGKTLGEILGLDINWPE